MSYASVGCAHGCLDLGARQCHVRACIMRHCSTGMWQCGSKGRTRARSTDPPALAAGVPCGPFSVASDIFTTATGAWTGSAAPGPEMKGAPAPSPLTASVATPIRMRCPGSEIVFWPARSTKNKTWFIFKYWIRGVFYTQHLWCLGAKNIANHDLKWRAMLSFAMYWPPTQLGCTCCGRATSCKMGIRSAAAFVTTERTGPMALLKDCKPEGHQGSTARDTGSVSASQRACAASVTLHRQGQGRGQHEALTVVVVRVVVVHHPLRPVPPLQMHPVGIRLCLEEILPGCGNQSEIKWGHLFLFRTRDVFYL